MSLGDASTLSHDLQAHGRALENGTFDSGRLLGLVLHPAAQRGRCRRERSVQGYDVLG